MTEVAAPREANAPLSGEPLLQVENLHISFRLSQGAVRAVRGVDLTLHPGEILALVGESGSGKSTIGHSLLGLLRFEKNVEAEGRAVFRDKLGRRRDLLTLSNKAMRNLRGNEIAMIFQEPMSSLNPLYTIGNQIGEAIRQHRRVGRAEARDEALGLLETLGLPNPATCLASYPHQISGGMRQRVMIAMALSCQPSLLIADEPTTALDVTIQAQIIDLLQRLQQRTGMAILFITHDLGLVAEIAHRAVVLYAGEVVETASTAALFEDPKMPYTRALLDAIPQVGCSELPDYKLRAIPGSAPSPQQLPQGCSFHARCAYGQTACREGAVPIENLTGERAVRCVRWRDLNLGASR